MRITGLFGIGANRILAGQNCTKGTVTSVKTCRWLKVNTKPVRVNGLDGAAFPHIISFQYCVNGTYYQGSRYISWSARCPGVGEAISVYYDKQSPSRYAIRLT